MKDPPVALDRERASSPLDLLPADKRGSLSTVLTREAQALCFFAGANSIFFGDKLLTAPNPEESDDRALLKTLGLAQAA